ncbi:MAG TPA: hypothetical protein VK196_20795 [Magnetospirillum sp.]|nr:hypothetical protein [Magnetospirillum sp.]
MIIVERQVHGYRQGHQLLAASAQLPKLDQSVIDRLSDVAGPLRPRERFEPYLTAYPLPSGERYVLARTWQDTTTSRAGCVRTLSLIIGTEDWSRAESLPPFLDLLKIDNLPEQVDATRCSVSISSTEPLPPVLDFRAGELVEALFLEEAQPVVVFDAPAPELIALRLLTALWPSMRRKFAMSTFALSPRKIGGRDFDLVFAPKDARSKFSDWDGRRIDGRANLDARHRWTDTVVSRVFEQARPALLRSSEIRLVDDGGGGDIDNAAMLRIALLWDELIEKLDRTPMAALGLLDIANSGKVQNAQAISSLDPALARAVLRASTELPAPDAWAFLSAIVAKMRARPLPDGKKATAAAAQTLAARAPEGAVALLSRPELTDAVKELLPRIACGLGEAGEGQGERALLSAPPELILRLLAANERLSERAAADGELIKLIGEALETEEPALVDAVGISLLPHLVEDWQLPAAAPLVARLDGQGLVAEISRLAVANDFQAVQFAETVVERARAIGTKMDAMTAIVASPPSQRRDALLAATLDPTVADVTWLLDTPELSSDTANALLTSLLHRAADRQLSVILGEPRLGDEVLARVQDGAPDLIQRAVLACELPIDAFVRMARVVLQEADAATRIRVAQEALRRCLPMHFDGDEMSFIAQLIDIVGERLDGAWAVRIGLGRAVPASAASRNMIAFHNAPAPVRLRVVWAIAELAQAICDRRTIDLDVEALEACALFMFEAEKAAPGALLNAAGRILPMLMRHRREPVSPMIAATFPMIYRELAKQDDVPILLQFIPFLDWDRCKAARSELVDAFMSSSWSPADLALTACRCGDVDKILRRTAASFGGEEYIDRVEMEIGHLPDKCRSAVQHAISNIRSAR